MTAPLRFRVATGHAPPARAPHARGRFLNVYARTFASVKGGDLNIDHAWARRLLGGKVVGEGVVWLRVSRKWRILDTQLIDLSGDHLAVLVRIERRRGRNKGTRARVLVVNAMGYSTSREHSSKILRNGLRYSPDLILGVECTKIRAALCDYAGAYRWAQQGRLNSAESNPVIGVAKSFGQLDGLSARVGSAATAEGGGIDTRVILVGRVTTSGAS